MWCVASRGTAPHVLSAAERRGRARRVFGAYSLTPLTFPLANITNLARRRIMFREITLEQVALNAQAAEDVQARHDR